MSVSRILAGARNVRAAQSIRFTPTSPVYLGMRFIGTASASSQHTVKGQLVRLKKLLGEVSPANSPSEKQRIIGKYPDLKELLERVCDPRLRTHMSFTSLQAYLSESTKPPPNYPSDMPYTLSHLLDVLESREHTGNAAKYLVVDFLSSNGVLEADAQELLDVFGRLLDRNLAAGFGAKTLANVDWANDGGEARERQNNSSRRTSSAFDCALGKTIEPPFRDLLKQHKWYISRKLDGVRCLTFLDFTVPSDGGQITLSDVQFLSRSGNPFMSLGRLKEQLEALGAFPSLRAWLEPDVEVLEEDEAGSVKRLVLDGEICVMRPGTSSNDDLVEDFPATVSEIRRGGGWTIQHPAYFLFDVLSWGEVQSGRGGISGRSFGDRVEAMEELSEWLDDHLRNKGIEERFVRRLDQKPMVHLSEVDEMMERAAKEGWEGLIFRADQPYKGGRSADIRKFKEWQDAEYTVQSLDTSVMRLAVDGVFGMHEACANIWIEHKGTMASVGSGFSVDQRLRYAHDPSLIVGKQVTVEYFSESEAIGRPGAKSLRFPRIKQVWEEGERTI